MQLGLLLPAFFLFLTTLSSADPPDLSKYLIKGDILEVRLGGFENDQLWHQRALGLVLISDRHNNTVRLCSDGLTDHEVKMLCYTMGYSHGTEKSTGLPQAYKNYQNLHILNRLLCKGTEWALEQCPRGARDFSCFMERYHQVELYCTNSWYGPGVPCGTDVGVQTAAENNPWSLDLPVAIELSELTGTSSRSLQIPQISQERIVGPSHIESAVEFPWTARLNFYNHVENKWQHKCGAAIITDRIVLTLAQCVDDIGYYSVTIGEFDTEVRNRFEETFTVLNDIKHPKFREDRVKNDLAIVVLSDKNGLGIQFRPSAFPVCLPTFTAPLYGNRKAVVAGWGKQVTPTSATLSRFLTIANVELYENKACPGFENPASGIICAGNPEGGSDACLWDLGAPLIAKIKERSVLAGLLREPGCGVPGTPSKYVSIKHHAHWIKTNVAAITAQLNRRDDEEEEEEDDDDEEVDIWADDDSK